VLGFVLCSIYLFICTLIDAANARESRYCETPKNQKNASSR
jgi:hypothetical protein